ncbi:MAG: group III truncated hemoglobin [Campylobacterota bacterium]|nr:group III truncated hemoglobin [Campylobacterota bacterium]
MLHDTVDRGKIEELVREFYTVVLKDDVLSPFFIKALGDDLKNGKWHEHLNTLVNFWMLMMEGKKNYWGDPFPPHAFLGPLTREDFERWLELFQATLDRLFIPELAEKFYKKAYRLSEQFIDNLDIDNEDDDDDW